MCLADAPDGDLAPLADTSADYSVQPGRRRRTHDVEERVSGQHGSSAVGSGDRKSLGRPPAAHAPGTGSSQLSKAFPFCLRSHNQSPPRRHQAHSACRRGKAAEPVSGDGGQHGLNNAERSVRYSTHDTEAELWLATDRRISHVGCGQRSSRSATGIRERGRPYRRIRASLDRPLNCGSPHRLFVLSLLVPGVLTRCATMMGSGASELADR